MSVSKKGSIAVSVNLEESIFFSNNVESCRTAFWVKLLVVKTKVETTITAMNFIIMLQVLFSLEQSPQEFCTKIGVLALE